MANGNELYVDMIQSAKAKVNKTKDPELWSDFSIDDVSWVDHGPNDSITVDNLTNCSELLLVLALSYLWDQG